MFESLFGADMPLAARLVIALVIVVGLIGLTAWVVRRFGAERLGTGTTRGRQPRLAVIDAATVDGRRRLILIRRDNIEHLMMIGGPTDVVVEANIVRAASAPRDVQAARPPAASDTLPRAVPLGEGTMWPLQPEPAPRQEPIARQEPVQRAEPVQRPEPMQRPEPIPRVPRAPTPPPQPVAEESMQWTSEPAPPPSPAPPQRRPRPPDPLAGLAEELSRTQVQAEQAGSEPRSAASEPRAPRREPREPRAPRAQPAPPPAAADDAQFNSPADQNLAEMAQRLEAALRRPAKTPTEDTRHVEPAPRAAPEPARDDFDEPPPPRAPVPAEARPARGEARAARAEPRPAPQKASVYDSLEQEMASLLGRPNSKP